MPPEIIDDPKLNKSAHNIADKAITVVGTGAVLYFLTLITLVLWYFAGLYFVDSVFSWRHVEDTFSIILMLVIIALFSTMLMLGWAEYNFRMYAHRNRRQMPLPVTVDEVADFFRVPSEFASIAADSKFLRLHTDEGSHFLCQADVGCFEVRKIDGDPSKGFQH